MKFKIHKDIIAALAKIGLEIGLSEYVILEGELLEGGTVEKCINAPLCCRNCYKIPDGGCPCHNKKEEKKCPHCGVDWFNRETPEVPEKLQASIGWSPAEYHLRDKISEIIDYLKAHE